jgi:zinc and cadmium transporter
MNLIVFLALVLPVVLCGLSVFFIKTGERVLKLILAFGGAFLLTISFVDLLPEIYKSEVSHSAGYFILAGFIIQLLLDFITKGVEHGHHSHHDHSHQIAPVGIMIGICIHSFIEGMPLADNFTVKDLQNSLLLGIIIHNIPMSIVLVSLLFASGMRKPYVLLMLFFFAFSAPLGTITSSIIGERIGNLAEYFDVLLAVVVGIFLHISTTILFETDEQHGFNLYKFIAILLGIGVSILILC